MNGTSIDRLLRLALKTLSEHQNTMHSIKFQKSLLWTPLA